MQTKIQTSDVTLPSTKSKLINSDHSFQSTISLQTISLPTSPPLSFQSTANTETNKPNNNPKTLVKLSSRSNSFFNDKRKWEDSFTVAEIKQLPGNIVKASKDNGGETHVTLQQESTVSALLHEDESSQENDHVEATYTSKPGRKPIPYDGSLLDSDQTPKMKRKAQNRAAQRAFRERKDHYVKELEIKLKQVQDVHLITTSQLVRENQQLRATVAQLEQENCTLKGLPVPFPTSSDSLPQYLNYKSIYPTIAPSLQFAPTQTPPIRSNEMISPILSSDIPTSIRTFQSLPKSASQRRLSSLHKTVPKRILPKQQKHDKTTIPASLSRAPLEYTFSICTPISLRPSESASGSPKETLSKHIEPVQLYPPSNRPQTKQKSLPCNIVSPPKDIKTSDLPNSESEESDVSVSACNAIVSTDTSKVDTSSTFPFANVQHKDSSNNRTLDSNQIQKLQQLESNMLECHIGPKETIISLKDAK